MEWQPRRWGRPKEGVTVATLEGEHSRCPLFVQCVSLGANAIQLVEDKAGQKPYDLGREKIIATTVKGRVNVAGVGALSRHLMAIERGRALGRKPLDLRAYALEQAARRWVEERARRK